MGFFIPIANVINIIIENWLISAAVLAVFASLCLGLFKGAKHGIRAMTVLLAVAISALCGLLIYYFVEKDIEGLIKFGIAWLPTIIFLIGIILSTLVGVHRGLRKSLILMLHAVIVAAVCLGLFFFCVTSKTVDKWMLDLINMFMGTGGLQSRLGVRSDCVTLREVLLELFNSYVVEWGQFGILLGANSAYVLALVNMAYRLVFAFIFFIVYEILLFILYLIYLIFYPERKYKEKRNIRFAMNKADSSYKKHPVGGGCVGMVRGLVSGLVSLSFIGSVFFIAVGGSGASKLPEDISFGDNYSPLVSIYRSIEDYGDQGIFKILNAISDPEDTPYYLFAADLVFSGGLDDEMHEVSGNVKFRKELAAYTGFAKNTLALLLKYDTNGEIAGILRGESGGDNTSKMNKILNVCINHEFRVEFENLIDNFDAQTYIINFAFSLADAVIANIDNMDFMKSVSADNKELLQVLFRRNYLSETIPDERDRKHSGEVTDEIPPYININHLLTKRDAQIVLDIVLSIIANEINVKDPHSIAKHLIPDIEELSILNTYRSSEMDPVFGRMYCYFDNKYLTDAGEDGITYGEVKNESVKWTRELKALLRVADGLVTMYDKVQNRGETSLFKTIIAQFDETSEDYEENVRMYEELTEVVADSAIMSKVLCSKKIYNFLNGQIHNFNANAYFPRKISYENKYDENGNLISHGEAYQILRGLRLLTDKDNKDLIDSLSNTSDFKELLKKLAGTITKDDPYAPGNSLASYFTESILFRSMITAVVKDKAGDMLVIPTLSLETEGGQVINIANKVELREIFDALPELTDLIIPLSEQEISGEDVNKILLNGTFNSLLDNGNKIVEATIANKLIEMLADNDTVIIPRKLENYDEWVTVNNPGELRKFLKTKELLGIDAGALMNGEGLNGTEILDKIKGLEDDSIYELFESDVFYYSASKMLDEGEFKFEDFKIIVPDSSCKVLVDEKIERVIKKTELESVFLNIKDFGLTSGMSNENVMRKLVEQQEVLDDSNIISASVVNFIVNKEEICTALHMPDFYSKEREGSRSRLLEYDSTNLWHAELPKMIGAIDEIFGISNMPEDEVFEFTKETTSAKTKSLFMMLNDRSESKPNTNLTRLNICYASEIIRNIITAELDKALNGNEQTNEELIDIEVRDSLKTSSRAVTVYSEREISTLVDSFEKLGFTNIDEIKADRFSSLTQYRSNIDSITASGLMRGIITKKIDSVLTEGESGIIDGGVKRKIKEKSGTLAYSAEEISDLIRSLDELGMEEFNNLGGFDFSTNLKNLNKPSASDPESTKLSVIYRSDIVVGIITKTVKDTFNKKDDSGNSVLVYHNGAERSDLAVLKEEELNSLISLLGEDDLNNFNVGKLSLENVRNQLEADDDGNPYSYLVAANFAKTITDNPNLYVPSSVYRNRIIVSSEAISFIDAVTALQGGEESLNGWNVGGSMILPDEENREKVLSSEIMRATFSHYVLTNNSGVAFSKANVDTYNRVFEGTSQSKKTARISAAQLMVLFNVIESCTDGKELNIPEFKNIDSVKASIENIDLLCEFDATRYSISKVLLTLGKSVKEKWYRFESGKADDVRETDVEDVEVLTADEIKSILQR